MLAPNPSPDGLMAGCLDGFEHVLPLRVYYEDTDAAGIVYYANYLRYAERARSDMLRLAGIEQSALARDQGLFFAVRRCAIDYHRPARLDDRLEIRSCLTATGGASATVRQFVLREDIRLASLTVGLACVDSNGRPARIPSAIQAALSHYCETPAASQREG